MMRRLHRNYVVPAAFDAEIDESMRRLQSTLAQVPGERYPVAANEAVLELLPVLRETFYRLENWLQGNWSSAQRKPTENTAEAERRRDLVAAGRQRTRRDHRSHRVGGAADALGRRPGPRARHDRVGRARRPRRRATK